MINVKKIFGMTSDRDGAVISWKPIDSEESLQNAINESTQRPVIIFKHSTRCSISSMAKSRLENDWNPSEVNGISPYYLDLISYRNLSNIIADTFEVAHESPQVLVIKEGKCIYHTSHMGISFKSIKQEIA